MEVIYFPPGSAPPVKVARWRTVYDVIWLKEGDDYKPYLIVMQRMRNGKVGLRLHPLDSYSKEVAEYVRQQIKNCWAAKLRGEEFRWFVKTYGMHPTAWCIRQIMYGKKFKTEEKKRWSDLVLEALVNKYKEMFGKSF